MFKIKYFPNGLVEPSGAEYVIYYNPFGRGEKFSKHGTMLFHGFRTKQQAVDYMQDQIEQLKAL